MKFIAKNSTYFYIKEKLRQGREFACYFFISVSLTFKTTLNNMKFHFLKSISHCLKYLKFHSKIYRICQKSQQNLGHTEYLTFCQTLIELCPSIQIFKILKKIYRSVLNIRTKNEIKYDLIIMIFWKKYWKNMWLLFIGNLIISTNLH